jgi:hypothetical protein
VSQTSRASPRSNTHVDVGDVPQELQADYQSFAINCSKCHDLERALAAPVTDRRHWDLYVAKMMRTAGSAIHESERDPILRFLYWYTDRKNDRRKQSSYVPASPASKPAAVSTQPNPKIPESAVTGTSAVSTTTEPSVTSEPQGENTP